MSYNEISLWMKIIDLIATIVLISILISRYKKNRYSIKLYLMGFFSCQACGLFLAILEYFLGLLASGPDRSQLLTLLGLYSYVVAGEFMILFSFNIFFSQFSQKKIKFFSIYGYLGTISVLMMIGIINTFIDANLLLFLLVIIPIFLILVVLYLIIIIQTIRTGFHWKTHEKLTRSFLMRFYGLLIGTIFLLLTLVLIFIEANISREERTILSVIGWGVHLIAMVGFFISFGRGEEKTKENKEISMEKKEKPITS
ncbi:MAG: hypothetical protein GY870_01510 [archaeon]|nr:hypothetical protein [archaeon]